MEKIKPALSFIFIALAAIMIAVLQIYHEVY
jgi:hypothetical protein